MKTLTADQQAVKDNLTKWLMHHSAEYQQVILQAHAGCGKTYTISEWVRSLNKVRRSDMLKATVQYAEQSTFIPVIVTAPTHKAVRVLKSMAIGPDYDGIQFKTLHSALQLKQKINFKTGVETFERERYGSRDIKYGVIIIDEASMIGADLHLYIIQEATKGTRIVYIGDPAQLPPIGEPISGVFTQGYPVFNLTQVIRQAEGNTILTLASEIREVSKITNLRFFADDSENVKGVEKLDLPNLMVSLFSSNYAANPDKAKVLAWKNDTVKHYNQWAREILFGPEDSEESFMVGDFITFKRPYEYKFADSSIMVPNNLEAQIISKVASTLELSMCEEEVEPTPTNIRGIQKICVDSYNICVRSLIDDEEYTVTIIQDQSANLFKSCLKALEDIASTMRNGESWKDFYNCKGLVADIDYCYAMTVHRSQGSSYERVLIIDSDIAANFNDTERKCLYYTAATRASKKLFIY